MQVEDMEAYLSRPQKYGDKIRVALEKELKGAGLTFAFPHQVKAVLDTTRFLQKSDLALVVAPTGSGKTGILNLLIYTMKAYKTMVLTPSVEISKQINSVIASPLNPSTFLEKTKMFQEGWDNKMKNNFLLRCALIETTNQIREVVDDVVIVNAQKFGGNSKYSIQKKEKHDWVEKSLSKFFDSFDLLIVDEAHHYPAPTWRAIIKEFREKNPRGKVIFLTATPYRNEKGKRVRILSETYEAFSITKEQLEVEVIRPLTLKELSGPPGGKILSKPLMKHMADNLFEALEDHDKTETRFKHQAMVLVETVKTAQKIEAFLNKLKPGSTKAIVGGQQAAEEDIKGFKDGNFQIAIVCNMLVEGFDNPRISICVVYRRLQSQLLLEHFLGRCLRRVIVEDEADSSPDKTEALLITYARFEVKKVWTNLNSVVTEEYIDDEFISEFAFDNVNAKEDLDEVKLVKEEVESDDDELFEKVDSEMRTSSPLRGFIDPLDSVGEFSGSKHLKHRIIIPSSAKGVMCLECSMDVTNPNHFVGLLACSKCSYKTACQRAMDSHREQVHILGDSKSGAKDKLVCKMNPVLQCYCGFSTGHPYAAAQHMQIGHDQGAIQKYQEDIKK